jgi:CBS domain-containing protein
MKKNKILIVDDEPDILSALTRVLRDEAYEIFTADSAEQAMPIAEKESLDLVICDHKMRGMSGMDFLEKLSKEKPAIVRILLTGYGDAELAAEAVNKSILSKFIVKPWDNNELKNIVRSSLEMRGGTALKSIRAGDIMSKFAITTRESDYLFHAANLMMRFKISGMPVLSLEGKLVGIVTASDLFRIMGESVGNMSGSPQIPIDIKIRDIMTSNVLMVDKKTPLEEIIQIMFTKNAHTIPVVEGSEIVGVIGRRDVLNTFYSLCAPSTK